LPATADATHHSGSLQSAPPTATNTARGARLYDLGQQAESRGDISAARRLYETAARDNYAPAALAVGHLYDPAYLADRALVGGVTPDIARAGYWYSRARDLGQPSATGLLAALPAR
jgi:TPR repeat protein